MMNLFMLVAFGFFGGLIRSITGLLKHKVFLGKERFKHGKFWFTIICSGVIGVFCALMTIEDYRIILLAGYAGTDFVQGIYGVVKK
jgi:fluoride ion exporter CrcB/FEX